MSAAIYLRQIVVDRLRDLMAARPDLNTQVKLARRAGLSQSTVARILSADTSATADSIADLARAFGVPPASLLLSDPVDIEVLVAAQGLTAEGRQRLLGYASALRVGQPISTSGPCLSAGSLGSASDSRHVNKASKAQSSTNQRPDRTTGRATTSRK